MYAFGNVIIKTHILPSKLKNPSSWPQGENKPMKNIKSCGQAMDRNWMSKFTLRNLYHLGHRSTSTTV